MHKSESGGSPGEPYPVSAGERRVRLDLREIFDEAYEIALPFIDPVRGWGGIALRHHAFTALSEAFPALTPQDVAILVPALESAFSRRKRTP
jgi:hypothetical protein